MRCSTSPVWVLTVLTVLTGCAEPVFTPGYGMSAANMEADRAKCRLFARGAQPASGFAASGSPRFVAGATAAALIVGGISAAARRQANFSDCMLAAGYQAVTPGTQPTAVAGPVAVAPLPDPGPVAVEMPVPRPVMDMAPPQARIRDIRAIRVNPVLAATLRLEPARGAFVQGVDRDGPPSDDDLLPGDVVLQFDGATILQVDDLERAMDRTAPHAIVHAKVWRDEQARAVLAKF